MGWMDVLYRSFDGMECGSGGGRSGAKVESGGGESTFLKKRYR